MTHRARTLASAALLAMAFPAVTVGRFADAQRRSPRPGATVDAGTRSPRSPSAPVIHAPIAGLDLGRMRLAAGHFVADLPGGSRATLTLDATWQRATVALLERHQLPEAAVVVLDTDTGRVLVWASRGGEPGARAGQELPRLPVAPAASVFKIVTTSALLAHGLAEDSVTCYSGGFHRLLARDLVSDPRRDRDCATLGEAFANSINTVFARRALERLSPDDERAQATAWGFGEPVPFDVAVQPSPVTIPTDTLEFARTAAGFWNSYLSAVHGAALGQAIARGGELSRPWIVDRVQSARGDVTAVGGAQPWRRATTPEIARSMQRMMLRTVTDGTAFHGFHDAHRRAYLDGITVGGKTGTLTRDTPYRAYTWFVGNAEGPGHRLSFAVLVGNDPLWRVKAATVARQVLQIAYRGHATD
ncbi:MAG: penicillin-binding protein [Deltaproteobacteria bacterium]|nr:penicillin-binding protein [Deltaproteobacteria bacterium]